MKYQKDPEENDFGENQYRDKSLPEKESPEKLLRSLKEREMKFKHKWGEN